MIGRDRQPHLTNDVLHDPNVAIRNGCELKTSARSPDIR